MNFIILRQDPKLFFEQALKIEEIYPSGSWEYTDLNSSKTFKGLYSHSETPSENFSSFPAHKDFLTYFQGTFSPGVSDSIDIHQEENFEDFCLKLNKLLISDSKILDVSIKNLWIWTEGLEYKVPSKLKAYLSFD